MHKRDSNSKNYARNMQMLNEIQSRLPIKPLIPGKLDISQPDVNQVPFEDQSVQERE